MNTMKKKQNKNASVLILSRLIIKLVPNIYNIPQDYLVKPDKYGRLIWNGSHVNDWRGVNMNSIQHADFTVDNFGFQVQLTVEVQTPN